MHCIGVVYQSAFRRIYPLLFRLMYFAFLLLSKHIASIKSKGECALKIVECSGTK